MQIKFILLDSVLFNRGLESAVWLYMGNIMEEKDKSATLVFAHRGASKEFPENTLQAFKRAAELGVDFIETDIRFTGDERFALIHDESIERTTNVRGNIADYSMDELKKLDAGYYFTNDGGKTYPYRDKDVRLMSLDELFEAFPDQKFDIDIKDKNPYQIKRLVEVIDKHNAYDRIIVASKYFANLKAFRKLCPQVTTAFSIYETLYLYSLYKFGLLFLNIHFKGSVLQLPEMYGNFRLVTKSFLEALHEKGIGLHVWTVNSEEDMRRLIDTGVDGIMTDDPALLVKVLGR
jgi:glycerophosphoryl diester phosphodiesterase